MEAVERSAADKEPERHTEAQAARRKFSPMEASQGALEQPA